MPDISVGASRTVGRGSAFAWKPSSKLEGSESGHRASGPRTEGTLAITYDGHVVPCIFNRTRILGSVSANRRLRDVLNDLEITPGPAADIERLSCGSCRVTDRALALLHER